MPLLFLSAHLSIFLSINFFNATANSSALQLHNPTKPHQNHRWTALQMALTEAEKRQQLRERRAAKMANSASRLHRITGDVHATEAPTTTSSASASGSATPTPQSVSSPVQGTSVPNKRISQSFNIPERPLEPETGDTADPPMESLDQFEDSLYKALRASGHQHQETQAQQEPQNNDQMDVFAKMLGLDPSALKGVGLDGQAPGGDDSDPFMAMLQQVAGGNLPPPPPQGEQVDNETVSTEMQKSDKFKAQFMLMKLLFTVGLSLYFFVFHEHHSSSYSITRSYEISPFTQIFTAFEVLTVSYYASILHKNIHYNYNSKILDYMGLVPEAFLPGVWKNRIKLAMKYWELIQLVLFDISALVVVFGILSFLH